MAEFEQVKAELVEQLDKIIKTLRVDAADLTEADDVSSVAAKAAAIGETLTEFGEAWTKLGEGAGRQEKLGTENGG
jgi:hypothetical protein